MQQHDPNDTQHNRPTDPAIDKIGSAQPSDAELLGTPGAVTERPTVDSRPIEGIPTETRP